MRRQFTGLEGIAALAALSAMYGGPLPRKSRQCTYTSFCGPIWPTTRQQRRAMMREAAKPIRRPA